VATIESRVRFLEQVLDRLLTAVEKLAGVPIERPDEDAPSEDWDDFLAELEPEAERPTVVEGRGVEFTDDEVFEVLRLACEANTRRCDELHRGPLFHGRGVAGCPLRDRADSVDVARQIAGRPPTQSEKVRAGQALGRLERAGRVRDMTRRGDGGKSLWAVADDAS
jgi:hypothetical protein